MREGGGVPKEVVGPKMKGRPRGRYLIEKRAVDNRFGRGDEFVELLSSGYGIEVLAAIALLYVIKI